MKPLSLIRKVRTKNDIGETVETDSSPVLFLGILLRLNSHGSSYQIDKNIPIDEVSHTLRCELDVSIKRDDIIVNCDRKYIVKYIDPQEDFGGTVDHQVLLLKHYE